MARLNVELMNECFPHTLSHGNSKHEIRQRNTRRSQAEKSKHTRKEAKLARKKDVSKAYQVLVHTVPTESILHEAVDE